MSALPTSEAAAAWRARQTGTVAVVAGAFDILHPGNLAALRQARLEADSTLVLLEPDAAVRLEDAGGSLQHPEAARAEVVAALRDVSAVGVAGPGARAWVDALRPFVWVTRAGAPTDSALSAALAQAASARRDVEGPADCTTAAIHAAMVAARTPIRVPALAYPAPASDDLGPALCAAARPLVTVNGCFDILHVGHVRFLASARVEGQRLVVLINDDASVGRYKGPTRPVFPIGFRAAALAALRWVDAVVPFSGDNPLGLIRELRPDVHVKGGSYEPDRVRQERELMESLGGRLVCTDLVAGYSTTTYIERSRPAG